MAGKSSKYLSCIPAVKIFAFLDLDQNGTFFKGLELRNEISHPVTTHFVLSDGLFLKDDISKKIPLSIAVV